MRGIIHNGLFYSENNEASNALFYRIESGFDLETKEKLTRVEEEELIIVPKGTRHHSAVKELVWVLLIKLDGTLNKENGGDLYED